MDNTTIRLLNAYGVIKPCDSSILHDLCDAVSAECVPCGLSVPCVPRDLIWAVF